MRGTLVICPDMEGLSREAARRILAAVLADRAARKEPFRLALAGGSTPRRLYEVLASGEFKAKIPWTHIQLFWGDERLVPHDHVESNYRMAQEALLKRVAVPRENVHPVPIRPSPDDAAQAYEQTLRTTFRQRRGYPVFNLVLLGLGADGHTASLFPGAAALQEKDRLVVGHSMGVKMPARVTLTLPVINRAERVYFLASGESKAAALQTVLEIEGQLPAQLVAPRKGELVWLVDTPAAGRLARIKVEMSEPSQPEPSLAHENEQ